MLHRINHPGAGRTTLHYIFVEGSQLTVKSFIIGDHDPFLPGELPFATLQNYRAGEMKKVGRGELETDSLPVSIETVLLSIILEVGEVVPIQRTA